MTRKRTAARHPKKQTSDDEVIEETKSSKRGSTKMATKIVEDEIIEDKKAKTKAKKNDSEAEKSDNDDIVEITDKTSPGI